MGHDIIDNHLKMHILVNLLKEYAVMTMQLYQVLGKKKLTVQITEVWHMAHFWVSYGRCTMPGSPMGRSEGSSRRWTG